ncbi:MAG: AIPR family protein, partial [Caldilineaceae bacterium]
MSQFHVSQIETHVRANYQERHWNENLDNVTNLSRLLALHAVNLVLGSTEEEAQRVVEITDGSSDRGIDGVGVDPSAKLVVFVQSKWRQDGTGSMGLADVLRFLDGVRALLGMRNDDAPVHASEITRKAVHNLLRTPGGRIRLVTATTASEPLAENVEQPIKDLLAQLNDLEGIEPIASHIHFSQADFFNTLTESPRPRVDIETQIQDWGRATEPLRAFYGRVNAAEIARWYQEHGVDLFAENIRVVIPRSDINEGILNTIREEPERFGYYNNGITVLSESIEIGPGGALNREVGFFRLSNASIVNGAQTVSTLGSVLGTDFEQNLGRAFVLVRCIEVGAGDAGLGQRITRFANTQNEVSSQDFAFLDSQQHRLVRELRVLGYEYILRSAETPKSHDLTKVIDVRMAALGLACASPNLGHAVIAKREISRLFSDGSVYRALFNPNTEALRLVRAVQLTREVDAVLDRVEAESSGVEAGVAVHGRRIIARLCMRKLGDGFLASPTSDVEEAMDNIDTS